MLAADDGVNDGGALNWLAEYAARILAEERASGEHWESSPGECLLLCVTRWTEERLGPPEAPPTGRTEGSDGND